MPDTAATQADSVMNLMIKLKQSKRESDICVRKRKLSTISTTRDVLSASGLFRPVLCPEFNG